MEGIETAALILWVSTFALGGFVTVEAGAIDVGDDRVPSVGVETDFADVDLDGFGDDESPNATVEAEGIDEGVERDAEAGLCVVGLDDDSSPIGIETDSEDSAVTVEPDSEYDPNGTHPQAGKTIQEIVDECATSPETNGNDDSPQPNSSDDGSTRGE